MYTTRFKSHHDASRDLKKYYYCDSVNKEQYVKDVLQGLATKKRVIYIHVPFCNKICSFCPFHRPDKLKRRDYHNYIMNQIKQISNYNYMKKPIDAINFGGGTPTALSPRQMNEILTLLKNSFIYSDDIEISVESSISELTDEMIEVLLKGGVNRLSIGVQTFQDKTRKLLNRRGSGEKAIERLKYVIAKGITNTSIDLIYNYPDQTIEDLKLDLDIIKSLNLAGISFYSLMIHDKTPLSVILNDKQKNKMLDLEHEYNLFMTILNELEPYGYKPLELTKLVRNNIDKYKYMEIRHSQGCCIAIGHGAGGNIENYVYRNSIEYPMIDNTSVGEMGRVLKKEYFIIDQMIYQMQKTSINLDDYSLLLNINLNELLNETLELLVEEKMIIKNSNGFCLTKKGIFYGNNIIADIVKKIIEA